MQHCRSIKKIPTRYLSRTSPPQHTHIPFQNVRTPHRTSKPLTTVSPTHPSKPLLLLQTHLQSGFSARRAAAHPQRTHSISLPLSLSLSLCPGLCPHTRARGYPELYNTEIQYRSLSRRLLAAAAAFVALFSSANQLCQRA